MPRNRSLSDISAACKLSAREWLGSSSSSHAPSLSGPPLPPHPPSSATTATTIGGGGGVVVDVTGAGAAGLSSQSSPTHVHTRVRGSSTGSAGRGEWQCWGPAVVAAAAAPVVDALHTGADAPTAAAPLRGTAARRALAAAPTPHRRPPPCPRPLARRATSQTWWCPACRRPACACCPLRQWTRSRAATTARGGDHRLHPARAAAVRLGAPGGGARGRPGSDALSTFVRAIGGSRGNVRAVRKAGFSRPRPVLRSKVVPAAAAASAAEPAGRDGAQQQLTASTSQLPDQPRARRRRGGARAPVCCPGRCRAARRGAERGGRHQCRGRRGQRRTRPTPNATAARPEQSAGAQWRVSAARNLRGTGADGASSAHAPPSASKAGAGAAFAATTVTPATAPSPRKRGSTAPHRGSPPSILSPHASQQVSPLAAHHARGRADYSGLPGHAHLQSRDRTRQLDDGELEHDIEYLLASVELPQRGGGIRWQQWGAAAAAQARRQRRALCDRTQRRLVVFLRVGRSGRLTTTLGTRRPTSASLAALASGSVPATRQAVEEIVGEAAAPAVATVARCGWREGRGRRGWRWGCRVAWDGWPW